MVINHRERGDNTDMVSRKLLMSKLVAKDMTISDLADAIGIHAVTLRRKINNHRQFTIDEVNAIRKALNLTWQDVVDIFFND